MNRLRISCIAVVAAVFAFAAIAAPHDGSRITTDGRVSSIHHERDGYRIELDRGGDSFWVPERALRDRSRDLRVGVSIRLGGIFRGGMIVVDVVEWPHRDILRGVVERVDERHMSLLVREERSGRLIRVDVLQRDREFNDLRRGDFVVLSGEWSRSRDFDAYRIESVRSRRF